MRAAFWNLALARNLYALSRAIENQPMISALQRYHRPACLYAGVAAMAAAILERDRFASFSAE